MSSRNTPYRVGEFWLDKRRDGKSPEIWQIARASRRSVVYRSTHCTSLGAAKSALDAFVADSRAREKGQLVTEAQVVPLLMVYWDEHGRKAINSDQTARSMRTFIAFLAQDRIGVHAVVTDLTRSLFERFREWRMGPHRFTVPWGGENKVYESDGVGGETVQRNVNDVRAAVRYAEDNLRIDRAPRIRDVDQRYKSAPRERVLSMEELAQIAWYCACHDPDLFRFVALQFATAIRPTAALAFNPKTQFVRGTLIDQQPEASPQTKKRNAVTPAIRPMRVILRAWAGNAPRVMGSRKTAWRTMRRVLNLTADVYPKTIRHTVATLLYENPSVPERQIEAMLGHAPSLRRTTQKYAKHRPSHFGEAVVALETLWLQVSRKARAYAADHLLTTLGQGGKLVIAPRRKKS